MFDIKFYKNSYPIKKKITQGEISADEFQIIEKELETINNKIDGNEKYLLENLNEIYKHLY